MSDLTKKSGVLYLSVFLLVICAAAGAIMTVTAGLTEKPIRERQADLIRKNLALVLPAFDSLDERVIHAADGSQNTVFLAVKNGKTAGKAVKAYTMNGYGGRIEALVGFHTDGRVYRIIVTSHNETPGIGTKVVDRKEVRRVSDLFCGKKTEQPLPGNDALDSYEGLESHKLSRENVHFISGATISSTAILDLVKNAEKIQAEVQ